MSTYTGTSHFGGANVPNACGARPSLIDSASARRPPRASSRTGSRIGHDARYGASPEDVDPPSTRICARRREFGAYEAMCDTRTIDDPMKTVLAALSDQARTARAAHAMSVESSHVVSSAQNGAARRRQVARGRGMGAYRNAMVDDVLGRRKVCVRAAKCVVSGLECAGVLEYV